MGLSVLRVSSRVGSAVVVAVLGVLVSGCGSGDGDAGEPSKGSGAVSTSVAATAQTVGCKEILAAIPEDPLGAGTPSADRIRSAMGAQDAALTPMVDKVGDPKVKAALRGYVQVLDQIKTAPDDDLVSLSSGPLQSSAKALDAACPN